MSFGPSGERNGRPGPRREVKTVPTTPPCPVSPSLVPTPVLGVSTSAPPPRVLPYHRHAFRAAPRHDASRGPRPYAVHPDVPEGLRRDGQSSVDVAPVPPDPRCHTQSGNVREVGGSPVLGPDAGVSGARRGGRAGVSRRHRSTETSTARRAGARLGTGEGRLLRPSVRRRRRTTGGVRPSSPDDSGSSVVETRTDPEESGTRRPRQARPFLVRGRNGIGHASPPAV